jgi:predicted nucleic acid-binding protein
MDVALLEVTLANTRRVFLDTSVCIAYHSTGELAHPLARHILHRMADESDPLVGYLSMVSVAELLVRPLRDASSDLGLIHAFLRGIWDLRLVDVDFQIAQQAANVRALTRLPTPDALIIGTALLAGCEAIVTNDERWARRLGPLYPQFTWVYLGA